jgi:hypothetical protein
LVGALAGKHGGEREVAEAVSGLAVHALAYGSADQLV